MQTFPYIVNALLSVFQNWRSHCLKEIIAIHTATKLFFLATFCNFNLFYQFKVSRYLTTSLFFETYQKEEVHNFFFHTFHKFEQQKPVITPKRYLVSPAMRCAIASFYCSLTEWYATLILDSYITRFSFGIYLIKRSYVTVATTNVSEFTAFWRSRLTFSVQN